MQKTEQRAFAAVSPRNGAIYSTFSASEAGAQSRASSMFGVWKDLEAAGWRIRPVLIRVEDETQETGHDR